PTGGETSASLMRLLALGVPAIVTRAGWFGELPEGVVAKVAIDEVEEEVLLALCARFAEEPGLGAAMGRAARRWVESEHEIGRTASAWLGALDRLRCAP